MACKCINMQNRQLQMHMCLPSNVSTTLQCGVSKQTGVQDSRASPVEKCYMSFARVSSETILNLSSTSSLAVCCTKPLTTNFLSYRTDLQIQNLLQQCQLQRNVY